MLPQNIKNCIDELYEIFPEMFENFEPSEESVERYMSTNLQYLLNLSNKVISYAKTGSSIRNIMEKHCCYRQCCDRSLISEYLTELLDS